jgi:hypothetical protein
MYRKFMQALNRPNEQEKEIFFFFAFHPASLPPKKNIKGNLVDRQ